jgi:hypothetical protein
VAKLKNHGFGKAHIEDEFTEPTPCRAC